MTNDVGNPPLMIEAQLELPLARLLLIQLDHAAPRINHFQRKDAFWIDLCLTPRRPNATGRYMDRWSLHRSVELGSLVAFPPGEWLELTTAGGKHMSLICQLERESVERFLPEPLDWTDRRLEACLNVASDAMRAVLLRLNRELREAGLASEALCQALVDQLSIELARYLRQINEPDRKGGLASWRQRIIDERVHADAPPPTVAELAKLCRISVRQLSRGFKAAHGHTVSEFIAQSRIEAAKRKLTSPAPLRRVARDLGFASQSSFTATFRDATSVTPGQYRKRVVKKRLVRPSALF